MVLPLDLIETKLTVLSESRTVGKKRRPSPRLLDPSSVSTARNPPTLLAAAFVMLGRAMLYEAEVLGIDQLNSVFVEEFTMRPVLTKPSCRFPFPSTDVI